MYYDGKLVRLRPPERAEVPLYKRWLMNPAMRQYITIRYMSLALEERWFEQQLETAGRRPPSTLYFIIELRSDGTPIGICDLRDINWIDRTGEFGITIGEPEYWGQGYGTDATRTMLEIGFRWYNLHRIYLRVHADNQRAIRAYERAGFKHEGVLREATFVDGQYVNVVMMSILADEFEASRKQEEAGSGL